MPEGLFFSYYVVCKKCGSILFETDSDSYEIPTSCPTCKTPLTRENIKDICPICHSGVGECEHTRVFLR